MRTVMTRAGKRALVLPLLACVLIAGLSALDVDRGELESASGRSVSFVNYEGPQALVETAAAIRGIGLDLGRVQAARGPAVAGRAGDPGRYQVIRAVDPSVPTGFDADILVIGERAQVDHIRNLRRILAGHLEAAWGYSSRDADTLAVFITVYNAVHRGDLEFFAARYKGVVTKELSKENAGLSTRFDEWAGKSRIVIPLSSGARPGALGAVDTGVVSAKDVTESLKSEPDKGVGERQALVDLKEREADQKKAEAEKAKAEVAKEEAALAAEKDRLAAERAKLEADKAAAAAAAPPATGGAAAGAAATAPGAGTATGAPPAGGQAAAAPAASGAPAAGPAEAAASAEAPAQEASLVAREAEIAKAEEAVAAKETELAAKKEEAAATEAAAESKAAEAASDRAAIAEDQKAIIAEEVATKAAAEAGGTYLLEVLDAAYPFARIVYADLKAGKLFRASTLNSIRARSVADAGDSFVAVAGREGGTGAVRLVRVDKAELVQRAQGLVDVHPDSPVWKFGEDFYAVVKAADGGWRLGRFDRELSELARSQEALNPLGLVAESAGGLAVQAAGGGFLLLGREKLEKLGAFKP